MSIGGFKAAKIRATTDKSTESGVILAYAANAKDTLLNVKDAIVGFGGWTWNEDLGYLSTDGTELVQYITYYTTLTHTNGAQLFISYGAAGVQFHWSCFGQYRNGSSSAYPTITESGTTYTLSDGQSGGWFSGLCMSMIPAGSSNHYGTPNRTDNSWMPSDATPILGYLGTNNATYKEATTISTAARMTTGNEYIYIINKDDLFMVMCHDPTWGGYSNQAGMGAPCYLGYVVGRLFENLNVDDTAYYAPYGWWNNQVAARITAGSPYMRGWSAAFPDNGSKSAPSYIGNNVIASSQADYGILGFFRKDGSKFSQTGPCGFFYAEPACEEQVGIAQRLYQGPQNARWYAMEVGIIPISDAAALTNTPVANRTQLKGTIRTDFMRAYVQVDPRYDTRFRVPPYGTKFENGNFIMGPCNIAIGWNSDYSDAETEELCPWRGQSGYQLNSSVDFGGYRDYINSIASTGTKIFIAGMDAGVGQSFFDSASIGTTTFDGATSIATPLSGAVVIQSILYNTLDTYLYLAYLCYDYNNDIHYCLYQITPSSSAYTRLMNVTLTGYKIPMNELQETFQLSACINRKGVHLAAYTIAPLDFSSMQICFRGYLSGASTDPINNKRSNVTYIAQDVCVDIDNNFYIICADRGTWSSSGTPNNNAEYGLVLYKYSYDPSLDTYTATRASGDSTYAWLKFNCGLGQAIIADNYGYIYLFYTTSNDPDAEQLGTVDMGVKKMKPDGTIVWTKHLGASGLTLSNLRAIYTFDNKIHFSGRVTGGALPGFVQRYATDTFFGTMTTDGIFSVKYEGGNSDNEVINTICCDDGYDYIGVNELGVHTNIKPKYELLKRTW